jgi:hypothetical protein
VRSGSTHLLLVVTSSGGHAEPAAEQRTAAWALPHLKEAAARTRESRSQAATRFAA